MTRNKTAKTKNVGRIISFFSGVARIKGLSGVFLHEVLLGSDNLPKAIVVGFGKDYVEALFFDDTFNTSDTVFRSSKPFSIPASDGYIGRIVDGLGNPKDGLGDISGKETPIFKQSPSIIDRGRVSDFLSTGIKVIDTALPLCKGQRELIIGDRKLGKSTLAIDTVLNQKHKDPPIYCVYVICGQKKHTLRNLISIFAKNNAFLHTAIVAATAGDSLAAQYLAPFVGCAIGEYFRDRGENALVVYDDLSKHAKTYRNIALLLNRAPGREAYPGDIFSLHAGLLERAAQLSKDAGGGSLTALPIAETQEGDITSFIPTNLISITDGQIYLERGLFQKRFMPAANVGLSVSRIGGQGQPKVLRATVAGIRLALAQHKELQKLAQLETAVSLNAKKKIHRGDLILELLKQEKHTNISWEEQTVLFYVVEAGLFDDIKKEKWKSFETLLLELVRAKYPEITQDIKEGVFTEKVRGKILEMVEDFKLEFMSGQI